VLNYLLAAISDCRAASIVRVCNGACVSGPSEA